MKIVDADRAERDMLWKVRVGQHEYRNKSSETFN